MSQKTRQLESRGGGENYHLGMKIDVVVKHVDLIKKQMDLILANDVF